MIFFAFCLIVGHTLSQPRGVMARVRPAHFAHKQTVHYKTLDYAQNLDTKTILGGLTGVPDGKFVAIVPLYGGKCYDITVRTPEIATAPPTRGLEVDWATFPVALLGLKSLHVSVFVCGMSR